MGNVLPTWKPDEKLLVQIDAIIRAQRREVEEYLAPIVSKHYPSLMEKRDNEYRKMLELSTKMTMVGRACTEIAGYPFDRRRLNISSLFGACCFLGDSFIDDFGYLASREYVERLGLLLEKGWFEIRNDREKLFYSVISRLFEERDILDPMLRQAITHLFLAQKKDVDLRDDSGWRAGLPRRRQLNILRECARDRSGHAITVLSLFLVPDFPMQILHKIYIAGSLIMYIDDHGDCYYDRYCNRITYMNQVKCPAQALRRIFSRNISLLHEGLPPGKGRDLLIGFLFRYYVTRLRKHQLERHRGDSAWAVYE